MIGRRESSARKRDGILGARGVIVVRSGGVAAGAGNSSRCREGAEIQRSVYTEK